MKIRNNQATITSKQLAKYLAHTRKKLPVLVCDPKDTFTVAVLEINTIVASDGTPQALILTADFNAVVDDNEEDSGAKCLPDPEDAPEMTEEEEIALQARMQRLQEEGGAFVREIVAASTGKDCVVFGRNEYLEVA